MAFCLFFELIGLNIGSATLLLALLGLRGCRRKPLFVRSHPVLADSGVSMGHYYYFGTEPTTPDLSVASTEGGMSSQLN